MNNHYPRTSSKAPLMSVRVPQPPPPTAPKPAATAACCESTTHKDVGATPVSALEASDPATRAWHKPEATEGWFSRREKRAQVIPRVEAYAFDPATQARDELYHFERDAPEPRVFYSQVRKDDGRLGELETTATGNPRTSVMKIDWHKYSGGVYDFEMKAEGYPDGRVICEGYCKKTDVGGALRWVAVVTKLHEMDLPASQSDRLFSSPLYEAIATGVAWGLWEDDNTKEGRAIKLAHPGLASGRPRPSDYDPASDRRGGQFKKDTRFGRVPLEHILGLGRMDKSAADVSKSLDDLSIAPSSTGLVANMDTKPSIHGVEAERWMKTHAEDVNRGAENDSHFSRYDPDDGYEGHGMEVVPKAGVPALGAIFPIRMPDVNVVTDGMPIVKMRVIETPVKFDADPELTMVSRYEVELYSAGRTAPTATLSVNPVAYPKPTGVGLALDHHDTMPKKGTPWLVAEREMIVVIDSDIKRVSTDTPGWDPRLHATVEAAMYKLRTDHDNLVIEAGV